MAFLFGESFDMYASASDVAMRWSSVAGSNLSLLTAANTAFGVGQGCRLNLSTAFTGTMMLAAPFVTGGNETTIYGSVRFRYAQTASNSTNGAVLQLRDGSTAQVSLLLKGDGGIEVRSGTYNGTLLGSAPAGTYALNVWNSLQFKAVIDASAGSVEVRMNSSTTPVLTVSGNTRAGTSNSYANAFAVTGGSINATANYDFDDIFLCSGSGAAPNSFTAMGDPRSVQLTPLAASQAQFSQGGTTSEILGSTATTAGSAAYGQANTLYCQGPFATTRTGSVSSATMRVTTGMTGNLKVALYDVTGSGGSPGNLLGVSNAFVNLAVGNNTATFATPIAMTAGQQFYIAFLCDTSFAPTVSNGSGVNMGSVSQSYASGFPASLSVSTTTTGNRASVSVTNAWTNAGFVADATEDGDTTYVYSSTAGQEDIYTLNPMTVTPASVIGVTPFAVCKKSDSGARVAGLQLQANGSADTTVTSATPALSYGMFYSFQPTDPTGAAWTVANVNGAKVGIKVVS